MCSQCAKSEIQEEIGKATSSTTELVKAIATKPPLPLHEFKRTQSQWRHRLTQLNRRLQSIVSDISGGGEAEGFPQPCRFQLTPSTSGATFWYAHHYDWLRATASAFSGIDIGTQEPYRTLQDQIDEQQNAIAQHSTPPDDEETKGIATTASKTTPTDMDCTVTTRVDQIKYMTPIMKQINMANAVAKASQQSERSCHQQPAQTWQPPFSPHDERSLATTEANSFSSLSKATAPLTASPPKTSHSYFPRCPEGSCRSREMNPLGDPGSFEDSLHSHLSHAFTTSFIITHR